MSISDCPINVLSPSEIESLFAERNTAPIRYTIRTPSRGRATKSSRKNRGRLLPNGRAGRRMRRFMSRMVTAFNRSDSLYDFLLKQTKANP